MKYLQVIKFIEKTARTGSLRSAGKELGGEIFNRHPAGLRPNTAGEILLRVSAD